MAYANDKIYGVVPQQAVHVADFKSYNDMHQGGNLTDLSHHPVCETLTDVNNKKKHIFFRGILPDNADVVKSNYQRFNDEKHAISLQVAGLCSACVDIGDKKPESLVMGMPVCFNEYTKKIEIDRTLKTRHEGQIGKFIDYVDDWHDSSIHAIICLYPCLNDEDKFTQNTIMELQDDINNPELRARKEILRARLTISYTKYVISNDVLTPKKRGLDKIKNDLIKNDLDSVISDKNITRETRETAQHILNEIHELFEGLPSDEDSLGGGDSFGKEFEF